MKIKTIIFLFGAIMLFGCGGKEESWSLKSVYPNFDSSLLKYSQTKKEQYFKDLEFINKNLKNCKLTINEQSISIATRGVDLRKFGLPLDFDIRKSKDTIYADIPGQENIAYIHPNPNEEQIYFVVLFENKQNLILKYYYLKNSYYNNFIFYFHKEE